MKKSLKETLFFRFACWDLPLKHLYIVPLGTLSEYENDNTVILLKALVLIN